MQPLKIKLGSIPKGSQTTITPVPGAPPPLQQEQTARPNAVGAQATVKSPKAKNKNLDGMAKSTSTEKGTLKLQAFINNRSKKINKK
jgi:hypothetical protein